MAPSRLALLALVTVPLVAFGQAHPRAIVDQPNVDLLRALQAPEVRVKVESVGFEVMGSNTPEDFAAAIRNDLEVFRKIVTAAGIRTE